MTDQHLPATATPASPVPAETGTALPVPVVPSVEEVVEEPRRPLRVALLPLALVTFVILAFVIAAWTFFAAAT